MQPRELLIASVLLLCVSLTITSTMAEGRLLGGLGQINDADEEIREICEQLKEPVGEMIKKRVRSIEPIHYRTQIVNGINYFIKAKLEEFDTRTSSIIHIRVHQGRNRKLTLSGVLENRNPAENVDYFQKSQLQ